MKDREITREEAIALFESKFWESMSYRARAEFQLYTDLLCMPFDVFQKAVQKTLGRPVWTHEFGTKGAEGLKAELRGEKAAPTFQEIVDLIPVERRIVIKIE